MGGKLLQKKIKNCGLHICEHQVVRVFPEKLFSSDEMQCLISLGLHCCFPRSLRLLSLCSSSSSPWDGNQQEPVLGLHPSSCEGCLVSRGFKHQSNNALLWSHFGAHLHTHMGMSPCPGHEPWPKGHPPPCLGEFSEDAGKSYTLLGQCRPFLNHIGPASSVVGLASHP